MRVLFVGDLRPHTRSAQRLRTLQDMGCAVEGLSFTPVDGDRSRLLRPAFLDRVRSRLGYPADLEQVNRLILDRLREREFDVLWVEKGLCIRPQTLLAVRRLRPRMNLALHSEDDMAARHNQSAYFRAALRLYDVAFTHKSYNARPEELPRLGARRVVYHPKSFDRDFHRPVEVCAETERRYGAAVGFIGTFESARARSMLALAEAGVPVRIWGNGWSGWSRRHPYLSVEDQAIYGEDYVRCVCATEVNLGFLRKKNRDLHTDRSVEIPACGGFLLAERTPEHQGLFREGVEAEFFTGANELLRKVRHYIDNPEEREAVARAGRERCLESDYSHHAALERMLDVIQEAA